MYNRINNLNGDLIVLANYEVFTKQNGIIKDKFILEGFKIFLL